MDLTTLVSPSSPLFDPYKKATESAEALRQKTGIETHSIGLVLGSGWGQSADLIGQTVCEIPAEEIPGFHVNGVKGHSGTLRSIKLNTPDRNGDDVYALVIGARTHYYEDKGVEAVAHGVRTLAACGGKALILTNGCGSLRREWTAGQVVMIKDHINITATSPLKGATFVDISAAYSPRLREITAQVDPTIGQGVYVQFPGPHYETPAEVKMAGILGGDLVGMSTCLETIAARAVGLEVLGLSLVTNLAAGISDTPLSHAEVLEAGQNAAGRISHLLADIIAKITPSL